MNIRFGAILFSFLGLAAVASAQETWSIGPVPAQQVTDLANRILVDNQRACDRFSIIPVNCTQANICTAASAPGGSGCTAAQARTANVRIFPATQAGREEYVTFLFVIPNVTVSKQVTLTYYNSQACKNFEAGNTAFKNAQCAAAGSPVPATVALGCDLSCK